MNLNPTGLQTQRRRTSAPVQVPLVVVPSLIKRLLPGAERAGVALSLAQVLGIALIALGVACWPGRTGLCGMLTYSALATGYLTWLGIRGEWVGPLLWPAVAVHAVLTILLGRVWLMSPKAANRNDHDSERVS